MTFKVLLTDAMVWALIAGMAFYARRVCLNPLAQASWRLVFQSRLACVSAAVLLFALLLTLLDSIHLQVSAKDQARYNTPIVSLLDLVVGPLAWQREKSYSEPLALVALSKEAKEQPDGTVQRVQPRLMYGGVHLSALSDRDGDLALRAWKGGLMALMVWAAVVGLCWLVRARQASAHAFEASLITPSVLPEHAAARAGLWTLLVLCVLTGVLWQWSLGYHVFGTDKVGMDVLYGTLKSLRTAVVIGLLGTVLTLPLGIVLGLAAGYFRGWVDDVIQYVYTTLNSIPSVLLIAASVLILEVVLNNHPEVFASSMEKADVRLFCLCLILGLTNWTGLARLLRGEVFKMREQDYVLAARACGVSRTRILFAHLLPNLMHIVLITLVMDFSGLVLAEAVLSYVGVGVDPSTFSFGTMINAARLELGRDPLVWWSLTAAFVVMLVLVLAANLFADAVREAFDPRARQLKQALNVV